VATSLKVNRLYSSIKLLSKPIRSHELSRPLTIGLRIKSKSSTSRQTTQESLPQADLSNKSTYRHAPTESKALTKQQSSIPHRWRKSQHRRTYTSRPSRSCQLSKEVKASLTLTWVRMDRLLPSLPFQSRSSPALASRNIITEVVVIKKVSRKLLEGAT